MEIHPLQLELYGDLSCPWCYLGKHRLARARAAAGMPPTTLRFRAFQLQPQLPAHGLAAGPFYSQLFGGEAAREQAFATVASLGAEVGISFQLGLISKMPNTLLAHRLVKLAARQGAEESVTEVVFGAFFERGVDIGNRDALLGELEQHALPLDLKALADQLATGEATDEVHADAAVARSLGIEGVPCVVASGQVALRGADSVEAMTSALRGIGAGIG